MESLPMAAELSAVLNNDRKTFPTNEHLFAGLVQTVGDLATTLIDDEDPHAWRDVAKYLTIVSLRLALEGDPHYPITTIKSRASPKVEVEEDFVQKINSLLLPLLHALSGGEAQIKIDWTAGSSIIVGNIKSTRAGQVIGRRGRIADAIRLIFSAIGTLNRYKIHLDFDP